MQTGYDQETCRLTLEAIFLSLENGGIYDFGR
jgi:hypothetical protein